MSLSNPKYQLQENGVFIIENYNRAKPFASFLPGVSGLTGIPLWAFYVNRGQGISSFGTRDKDHSILEFQPANKAYQLTCRNGFRTFIRVLNQGKNYEPFQIPRADQSEIRQTMKISGWDLEISDTNEALGLETNVHYYTLANEPFAGLVREVTFKNCSKGPQVLSVLDGLPAVVPYGMNNWLLKQMSRTAEAWIQTKTVNKNQAAFFNLKVEVIDSPEVVYIDQGHFYTAFLNKGNHNYPLKVVYDPSLLFGAFTDLNEPELFYGQDKFEVPEKQILANKTPCAFSHAFLELQPGESAALISTAGHIKNIETLQATLPKLNHAGFFREKAEENKKVISGIEDLADTKSAYPAFDHYCRQSFLDNILRGGLPHAIPTKNQPFVFHVYWRKHGDLERDYNHFQVMPTYYAQGNANYRDVNQNRRMDPWINPDVAESNILTFLNLIQLDGFNPLVLRSVKFQYIDSPEAQKDLESVFNKKDLPRVLKILSKPLPPGEFLMLLEKKGIEIRHSSEDILGAVLGHSHRIQEIDPSEGYWVDHWHYNIDLLESYLGLYPEKLKELLTENKHFTFYDNPILVRPRKEKHVLYNGKVRQFSAVYHDKEKEKRLHEDPDAGRVKTQNGKGEVYHTTLLAKLFVLFLNKAASLDPHGTGIEMEAERPNWYDALNGLPGLLGSSASETFELKRLARFLKKAVSDAGLPGDYNLTVPKEAYEFFLELDDASEFNENKYWHHATASKEDYRKKIRFGIDGEEDEVPLEHLLRFLNHCEARIDRGLKTAWSKKDDIPYSYFRNEVTDYIETEETNEKGLLCVESRQFDQTPLPLFLEGVVHALRLEEDPKKAKPIYDAVRKSGLYDKKIGMYKVNASLEGEPMELGRNRVFSDGWLENGSVFMHMEFKYLLEILRSGLVDEFYNDLKTALPAFMDPAVYGRSLIENSTFIASSNNPDAREHGRGFVARLSGTNAEWVHIWHLISVGKKPFQLNSRGELVFSPSPLIPADYFLKEANTFSFNFLGKTRVTYHNPGRKNTYGKDGAKITKYTLEHLSGNKTTVEGETLHGEVAEQVRNRQFKSIEIELN